MKFLNGVAPDSNVLDRSDLFDPSNSEDCLNERLVDLLTDLGTNNQMDQKLQNFTQAKFKSDEKLKQTRLTEYFNRGSSNKLFTPTVTNEAKIEDLRIREKEVKKQGENKKIFQDILLTNMHLSVIWGEKKHLEREVDYKSRSKSINDMGGPTDTPPLQDTNAKPVLVGADVSALYPNLDKIVTAAAMYEAVLLSDVKFSGFDFERLAVFLYLTMGEAQLIKCGLEVCIPKRRFLNASARSLSAKGNRDMAEWIVHSHKFTDSHKKEMIARMIQLETLVLMSSSCYSFGGKLFLQKKGAGIGERNSACIAKCVMSIWDKLWVRSQQSWGVISPLFIRYIDDIRLYVFPLTRG